MMTACEILERNGIFLKSYEPGNYYTICPQCSPNRKRGNQKKECLGVKVDERGATWHCNHCGWSGPEKGSGGNGRASGNSVTTYDYQDASGTVTFQKVRAYDKNGEKFFWLRRPNGNGGWINNTEGVDTSILYRLPQVIEAIALGREIALVEGEKDADRMWSIGIPATCNTHGAADPTKNQKPKWRVEHSEQLRGAPSSCSTTTRWQATRTPT